MPDPFCIPVQVSPNHIDVFNKILEAYDNLALVTAVDPGQGRLVVRVTPDTRKDTLKLLQHMPFPVEIME
ncbi:DUF4911 domain-containing protein [Candidatus Formimonas warabiya]|uniref:DUF4911 domain-containing protein n=1 Tax=Formimonas warabiya TaxID=1761012 RepID=A0A3G1KNI5_FORW1|nr:DUF4911 domain-containing protein [Candidatus Formimonas warabiya]ATW23980.1 hypothetical protein DCMF_03515 [Candidatus Formimonas warabiya]